MFLQFFVASFLSIASIAFPFADLGAQPQPDSGAACPRPAFEGSRLSKTLPSTADTVVADFNRDGRLDIANQSSTFQTLSVQLGIGNGYFDEPVLIDPASTGAFLVTADFNNDGHADLLTPIKIYLGVGDGSFSAPRVLSLGSSTGSLLVGDFNGDDKADFAGRVSSSRNIEVFYGDGMGRFATSTVVDFITGNIDSFTVADMNNDQVSDLVTTLSGNAVGVALGSTTGLFNPPVSYPVGGSGQASSLANGDVDGDGDLDIVTASNEFSASTRVTTLLNNGSGVLAAQPQFTDTSSGIIRLMLADVNLDTKLDLLATNSSGVVVRRFGNNDGTFQATRRLPGLPAQVKMFFEDFTGDGIRDLGLNSSAGVGVQSFGVLVNDGAGNLGPNQLDLADLGPIGMASADFNEDGKMDVVVANELLSFWVGFGDGAGSFVNPLSIPVATTPRAVLVADINNDGNQDIFAIVQNAADQTARTWVAFGNGNGTFGEPVLSVPIADFRGARMPALVDFDRDGFLDLATPSMSNNRVAFLKGFGTGGFAQQFVIDLFVPGRGMTAGDFDQDGHQDLAVLAGSAFVFLNNGTFLPTLIGTFPAGNTSSHIHAADFNNDNILDLATTTDTIGGAIGNPGKVVILKGVGKGGFGAPTEYLIGRGSSQMTTADFDGDGNRDLAIANSGYNLGFSGAETRVTVMFGDGGGVFPRIQHVAAANYPKGIAAIDIDTDGDMDIVTPDWGQGRLTLLKNVCLTAPASLPQLNANADVNVTEGNGTNTTVTLTVTLSAPSTVPVRVRYYSAPLPGIPALVEGEVLPVSESQLTIGASRDYLSAKGTLEFAPGQTSKTLQFTVRDDQIDEYDEYVRVFLADAVNASIGDNQTLIRIIDNDDPPVISVGDLTTIEGNTGENPVSVPVSLSAISEKPVSVQFVTVAGTAAPNVDYRFAENGITLPAGQLAGTISVTIMADMTVEADETFAVQLRDASNATIGDGTGTVTIMNDDLGGTVQLSASSYSGQETTGLVPVVVNRTGGSGGGVSVRLRTLPGTATPVQDYVEKVITVHFADNELSKTLQMELVRDELDEPDETFNVVLDQPSGVTIGTPSSAIFTILDSETPPNLSIVDGAADEGNSGDTTLKLFLTLSRPSQRVITVNYQSVDETATAGSDYEPVSGVFTINPGVTRAALNVVVHGDTTHELNETFLINLTNAVNANLTDAQGVGTIINDEPNLETNLEFISLNQAGTGSANGDSIDVALSWDGNVAAFESFASNLAGPDINGTQDIYVRDRKTAQTRMVSINLAGTSGGNCSSRRPLVSGNGRFVVFTSCASDLVAGGVFSTSAVFIRDLQTNETRLISVSSSGALFNGDAWALSHDGRYVVLQSNAPDITSTPDAPNTADLFVRDTVANTTELVTINAAGTATGNLPSGNVSLGRDVLMTPDGRYILFPSTATNLVSQTAPGGTNIFVRDRVSQTTTAVTVNSAGTQLVGGAAGSISDDGRYVFFSSSSNAVTTTPTDTNTQSDVFRRDMQAGSSVLVSFDLNNEAPGNFGSGAVRGSADGRYAAFVSSATNLTSTPDANALPDIFWRDVQTGLTKMVSINAFGTGGGNHHSEKAKISGDGQRVVFTTSSSNLIPGADNNSNHDQYMRDMSRSRTYIPSSNRGGTATGNQPTIDSVISRDGSVVAYVSSSSNLLPNDLNGLGGDVYAFSVKETAGNKAPFDFDGDGKTDIGIFRSSVAEWWINRSSNGTTFAAQFGGSTDRIVPADYTGDGKADIAVWRPASGEWFVLRSEDFSFYSAPFGANGDTPVPADYDNDDKTDFAVFRPASATWFVSRSSGGTTIEQFGANGDQPVAADFDGDGKADLAIFRQSNGQWWLNRSTAGVIAMSFGSSTDRAVQGDYTGDGKADVAFWRPSTGEWYVLRSEDFSFFSAPFGASTDVAAPGDYDGDGKYDFTVFRPSSATWFSQRTTSGTLIQQFGATGDTPVANAFVR